MLGDELKRSKGKRGGALPSRASVGTNFVALFLFIGVVAIVIGSVAYFLFGNDQADQDSVVAVAALDRSYSEQEVAEFGATFNKAMSVLDSLFLKYDAQSGLAIWSGGKYQSLIDEQNSIIQKFGSGQFEPATEAARSLITDWQNIEHDWMEAHNNAYADAVTGHAGGDYHAALASITQALSIDPDSVRAKKMASRIAVMPEIAPILEAAKAAQAQNDWESETAYLKDILALDGAHAYAVTRHNELATQSAQRHYQDAIRAGQDAVSKRDAAAAGKYLATAQALFPKQQSTRDLKQNIKSLRIALAHDELVDGLQRLAAQDDWGAALAMFNESPAASRQDGVVAKIGSDAKAIVEQKVVLLDYLKRHQRLSDQQIRLMARSQVEHATTWVSVSKSLATIAGDLSAMIDGYEVPVPVIIRSDSQTYIQVLGIGQVGKVEHYEISLPPGKYVLEGTRAGFRSVRRNLVININDPTPTIEIVCNDRIK